MAPPGIAGNGAATRTGAAVLEVLDDEADDDGTIPLQRVVEVVQERLGSSDLFPGGRLTNDVRSTKTDMEARCEVERVPGSSPQRISRWRDAP